MLTNIDLLCLPYTKWVSANALGIKSWGVEVMGGGGVFFSFFFFNIMFILIQGFAVYIKVWNNFSINCMIIFHAITTNHN